MSRASSWSSREADFGVREAALDAARRAGLTLQDWLDETWRLHAAELRASIEDLDDDERAYAVARRLSRRRPAAQGLRRSDRSAEASAARRAILRGGEEPVWSRVSHVLDDLDSDDRRPPPMAYEREDLHRETAPKASLPRARFSVDEAVEEITERQSELERPGRRQRAPSRDEGAAPYPLKRELAKLADALADLQRDAAESASASEVDALRRDVAQIARGLSALAPRDSIEHIEAAVQDLARRIADARSAGLVDEFIAPVEALIGDLKRSLLGASPIAALEAIEKRVGALSRHVEALAQTRVDPDSIANLLEHSHDIREMLGAAQANRPNVEALERRIVDLAARIDRIAERGQTSAGFDAIVASVSQIRDDLEQQNPLRAIRALDGRIDALARQMDQAASRSDVDAHFDRLAKRLDAMHRDLAERAPDGRRLEEMFQGLQARIEQARPAASGAEIRDLVGQLMGRIDQAIAAGAEPASLSAIEEQISRVAGRLESRAESRPADLARIETLLEAISQRLDNPLPINAADQVQETVRLLIERFEATLRNGVTAETLAGIETRLGEMAARLDAPVTAELDTARLESMIQDLAQRMQEPGVSPSDVAEIKYALGRIADRVDASMRGEADQGAMRGLEEQIAALTQRVGAGADAGVARLERSLLDIQGQMERLRGELESPTRETLEREIADLRSLHSASDRKTHSTLNAVHETLEKVVDRLAMLEDEIDAAAKPAFAPAARSEPQKDAFDDYRPSIELNFGPADADPIEKARSVLHAPAPVEPQPQPQEIAKASAQESAKPSAPEASPLVAERLNASTTLRASSASAPKINSPITDDFLLEPGSGKPSPRDVATALQQQQAAAVAPAASAAAPALDAALGAPEAPAPEADHNAQANFIAAVRRAQQTTQVSTGNQLLEEARARARAAAAEAEAAQAKASGSKLSLKSLFSGRRNKTTAAGLSGLVVALGALYATQAIQQDGKTPHARSAESAAARPAQQAQAPAPRAAPAQAARAEAPVLGAVAPPSDRFTQAAAPAVDMTPVASVPLATGAASKAAAARDPYALAAAGDAAAQYELGLRFAEGRHATRDAAKALDWFAKAAAQSYAPAQYRLGVIYEKGVGVPRDAERARTLYLAAAERGNVKAMHNLGALLADGGAEGKPDYAGAARWFRRAAEFGVRDSQYNLAILSARGLGVQQDLVDSYVWFSAASAQGDADAGAKLKEVAARLDAAQLARAQSALKAQRPRAMDAAVNEPLEPEGGWAAAPEPAAKPTASRSPKISSLQTR